MSLSQRVSTFISQFQKAYTSNFLSQIHLMVLLKEKLGVRFNHFKFYPTWIFVIFFRRPWVLFSHRWSVGPKASRFCARAVERCTAAMHRDGVGHMGETSVRSPWKTPKFCSSYCWWLKSCTSWWVVYPIIYRLSYILGGAGFQPSSVTSEISSWRVIRFQKDRCKCGGCGLEFISWLLWPGVN